MFRWPDMLTAAVALVAVAASSSPALPGDKDFGVEKSDLQKACEQSKEHAKNLPVGYQRAFDRYMKERYPARVKELRDAVGADVKVEPNWYELKVLMGGDNATNDEGKWIFYRDYWDYQYFVHATKGFELFGKDELGKKLLRTKVKAIVFRNSTRSLPCTRTGPSGGDMDTGIPDRSGCEYKIDRGVITIDCSAYNYGDNYMGDKIRGFAQWLGTALAK